MAIPPEQAAPLVDQMMAKWEKFTDAQKETWKQKFTELMGNPDLMKQAEEEGMATFKASDTNGNGKLNRAEFIDHSSKEEANYAAKGWPVFGFTDEEHGGVYDILAAAMGADADGLTADQLKAMEESIMGPFCEKIGMA